MVAGRWFRHLLTPRWLALRSFPPATLAAIECAIVQAEAEHDGQIRFAVEAALDFAQILRGLTARQRALEVFSSLRVWDTERNNGVLVYVLLGDRDVEILADRGICAGVDAGQWERICALMQSAYAVGDFQRGSVDGVVAIRDVLKQHFPSRPDARNELPDAPIVL